MEQEDSAKRQRRRGKSTAKDSGYLKLIDEALRRIVGGQKLLLESDLTKADLLAFLKAKGFIREVKGVVEVTVQTMDGGSFGVTLEEGGTVADLKPEIQGAQGAATYRQQLFMLGEGVEGGSEVQEPLSDDQEIGGSHTVMLCVQPEEDWAWDAQSSLLEKGVFELTCSRSCTKLGRSGWHNCMMAAPVMRQGTHTISLKLHKTAERNNVGRADAAVVMAVCFSALLGVVRAGSKSEEDPLADKESTEQAWLMGTGSGELYGASKWVSDGAGRIAPGQIVTMQVNLDVGSLNFWRDGKKHGRGWSKGVTAPLCWTVSAFDRNIAATIVPTPQLD